MNADEMLEAILGSLRGYPYLGGDFEVNREVDRIREAAMRPLRAEIASLEQLTANLDAHIIGLEKENVRLERKLDWYREVETDEKTGWCLEHPRQFSINAHSDGDECQTCRAERAERERDEVMEKACAAIREACEPCGGKGYIGGGSRSDHDCGGDDSLCAMRCPIEVAIEPDECEYCGRPIAAIRAAFAADKK